MRRKRTQIANPAVENILHITQRCVRQDFFMNDKLSTKCKYHRRRDVILFRLRKLASAFAIDVLRFSILENHFHVILRNRPSLVAEMDDEEVARRWLVICPGFCQALADFRNKTPEGPTEADIKKLAENKKRIAELRSRLSSVSYFMWALNGYCAKLFNLVDQKKGHFWEDRYKVKVLLDNLSTFVGAMYVDLNPIRANACQTPETSEYTSVYCQIKAAEMQEANPQIPAEKRPDAFISPLEISNDETTRQRTSVLPTRASDFGFLGISLQEYLLSIDIVGRIIREDKKGFIPPEIPPIFERLKISWENALELITAYDTLFRSFVGNKDSLAKKAAELGGHKLRCPAEKKGLLTEPDKSPASSSA